MKSERRHDLETNELVIWLEKFKPYAGQVTAIVSAAVALIAINSIWTSSLQAKREAAWDSYAVALDTRDSEQMALLGAADNEDFSSTSMPEWAHATWADRQLLLASQSYLANRQDAFQRLKKIAGIYNTLSTSASTPEVQNRARFSLGRVYELQNKLDEARSQYESVQGDLKPLAQERLQQLERDDVQEACAWLASAELPRNPLGAAPGSSPKFEADVPAADQKNAESKILGDLLDDFSEAAAGGDESQGGSEATPSEEATEPTAPAEEEPGTSADAVQEP